MSFSDIPLDVIRVCFEPFLDLQDLSRLKQTSKATNDLFSVNRFSHVTIHRKERAYRVRSSSENENRTVYRPERWFIHSARALSNDEINRIARATKHIGNSVVIVLGTKLYFYNINHRKFSKSLTVDSMVKRTSEKYTIQL